MKNYFTLFAATISLLIISCNKDQKLISEIAGEYTIQSIINYNKGEEIPVNFQTGKIFFENCEMKDEGGGSCTGWFEFDGLQKVTFQYYTRKEQGAKTIKITNPNSFKEPIILGYYEFKKEGNLLIFSGKKGSEGSSNGVSFSEYSDIKLIKN